MAKKSCDCRGDRLVMEQTRLEDGAVEKLHSLAKGRFEQECELA